jgi:DNA processing protein
MDETQLSAETLAPLDDSERFDWLRLLRCENIGPRTFQVLLSRHGSAGAALAALPALIASGNASRPIRIATIEEIEREVEATLRAGARFIGFGEPDYPALLRRSATAPPVIAVRGNGASLRRSKIAIVGARNASAAGLALTAQLARGIARAGHVIVSGLARGIDARAHQATIESGTIAVLAGGLGNIYPAEHEALLEQIVEQGAAISEMPFGWEAQKSSPGGADGFARSEACREGRMAWRRSRFVAAHSLAPSRLSRRMTTGAALRPSLYWQP